MTMRFAGPNNGYVPETTGQVVAFIRKPDRFKLNNYVQLVQSPHPVGLYSEVARDEAVRMANTDDARWEDGADMPTGLINKSRFQTRGFTCTRYAETWQVGQVAAENANLWKPKLVQLNEAISKTMTRRTKLLVTALETASNWSGNTGDANTINGGKGKWKTASDDPASPNYNAIAETFLGVAQAVNLYTNSVVQISDMQCIISPIAAKAMALSPEMRNYMRQTETARRLQTGDGMDMNTLWGLPSHYQGIKIVVEDAAQVTERAKASGTQATANRTYIKSDTSAVFCSRVGGLDGEYGSQSFSTVQCFYYKELLRVKQEYDSWNEKFKGAVIEYFDIKIAAPISGYLVTNIL